jgi:hypothetical protein
MEKNHSDKILVWAYGNFRLNIIWNLYYFILSLGKRCIEQNFFRFVLLFILTPVDFNVDVIQYIVLFFLLFFWYNYLQFLFSLRKCHAEIHQAYMRFLFGYDVRFCSFLFSFWVEKSRWGRT